MLDTPLHWARSARSVLLDWYPGGAASLSPALRQTLHALLMFADADGVCWAPRRDLALMTGVAEQQAYRRLADLRRAGVIGEPVFRRSPEGVRQYGHPILRPSSPPASDLAG